METFDWENRIKEWSYKRIEALSDRQKAALPSNVIESGYLGYPGASEEQITTAEARLGVTLPSSYREFLKFTNGLRPTSEDGINFYSTEEINWFAVAEQNTIDEWIAAFQEFEAITDEEYFVYVDEQGEFNFRTKYL